MSEKYEKKLLAIGFYKTLSKIFEAFRIVEPGTVSEWADRYRYLPEESSSEPGRWRTDRAPYQKGFMDALTDDDYEIVVWMSSSQVGKTEGGGLNWIGFTMSEDPCPMLIVLPNIEEARLFSKIRLRPMIRDTPALHGLIRDKRGASSVLEDSSNEILHKSFPGGHITLVGSNSPSGLASKPIRRVYFDELDRCEPSAGNEGDQVQLTMRRMETFPDRKLALTSSPTEEGSSRIEKWYDLSDQRKYYVPCPHCNELQVLLFENLKWDKDERGGHLTDTAYFVCTACEVKITEDHKQDMLSKGQWIAENPESKIAGFWIWAAYSPWVTWASIAAGFILAKKQGWEELKAFTNTVLGETWKDKGKALSWKILADRAESIPQWNVPREVLFLTAGVDVQLDRLEASVWGWGLDEESWLIGHHVIYGDPEQTETWTKVDDFLFSKWQQPAQQREMILTAAAFDTGYKTQAVYRYVRKHPGCLAVKGASPLTAPRLGRPTYQDVEYSGTVVKDGLKLWQIGTHLLKQTLYSRLGLVGFGARYVHFPMGLDEEYYKQLTAEKFVTILRQGKEKQEWRKMYNRNEALDCALYAYAAALIIGIERISWSAPDGPSTEPRPTPNNAAPVAGGRRRRGATGQAAQLLRG